MRKHIFTKISWLVILSGFALLLLFGYWLLYPYKIIEFKNTPFKVVTPVVKIGEPLLYEVSFCKEASMSATLTKSFVDGIIYTTPEVTVNNPTGCYSNIVYSEVPPTLQPSKYRLMLTYKYKVNPLREIVYTFYTEYFTIVK